MIKRNILLLYVALNVCMPFGSANAPDRASLHKMFHNFLTKKMSEQPRMSRMSIPPHLRQIASIATSFAITYFIQDAISRNIMLSPEAKLMRSIGVFAAVHAAKHLGRSVLIPAARKAAKKAHTAARGISVHDLLSKQALNLTPHQLNILKTQVNGLLRNLSQEGILKPIEGGFDPFDEDEVASHKERFSKKNAHLYELVGKQFGNLIYETAYGSVYSGPQTYLDLARKVAAFVHKRSP